MKTESELLREIKALKEGKSPELPNEEIDRCIEELLALSQMNEQRN